MSTDAKPFPDFTVPPCLSNPTMKSSSFMKHPSFNVEENSRVDLLVRVLKLEIIVADLQKSLIALEDDRAQRPSGAPRKSARTPPDNEDIASAELLKQRGTHAPKFAITPSGHEDPVFSQALMRSSMRVTRTGPEPTCSACGH